MASLATYTTYRKVGRELMNKVMKASLDRAAIDRAAKLLGIARGGVLVFDSEEEMAILFDFALNDCWVRDQNAVERYAETVGPANAVEQEILVAFASASTSLYRVVSASESERTVLLRDLLHPREDVQIVDINLSRSAIPGILLFIRLVSLRDFAMASGFMFAFPSRQERRLLAGYRPPVGRVPTHADAQRRFIHFFKHFFKAYKASGLGVRFEETIG